MLNGQDAYTGSVEPLISYIDDARGLASNVSWPAKDKKGHNGTGKGGPKK
jgi:hypothetical protein